MNSTTNVIIRLQKLPWEAVSMDIREFFRGLSIPEGGVHIIGGADGDAFIAFSTDEDARQAMRLDGKRVKGARVKLYLSSRVEMQQVIDKARVELQQQHQPAPPPSHGGYHQNIPNSDTKEKSSRRRRSRSKSGDRDRRIRRRTRSRSREKRWSKEDRHYGSKMETGHHQSTRHPNRNDQSESESRYGPNQHNPSVLDRTTPAAPWIDSGFLDRAGVALAPHTIVGPFSQNQIRPPAPFNASESGRTPPQSTRIADGTPFGGPPARPHEPAPGRGPEITAFAGPPIGRLPESGAFVGGPGRVPEPAQFTGGTGRGLEGSGFGGGPGPGPGRGPPESGQFTGGPGRGPEGSAFGGGPGRGPEGSGFGGRPGRGPPESGQFTGGPGRGPGPERSAFAGGPGRGLEGTHFGGGPGPGRAPEGSGFGGRPGRGPEGTQFGGGPGRAPDSSGRASLADPTPFTAAPGPPPKLEPTMEPGAVFGVPQQQQQSAAAIAAARASRRALLPAPAEPMETPVATVNEPAIPQRPQLPPPLMQQEVAPVADWAPPPFNPMAHGRTGLLTAPGPLSQRDHGLCVVLTAVPLHMQRYGEIRKFLHPLDLEGPDKIKIAVDERGQRTGQVYCKFLTVEDADMAVTYSGRENIKVGLCSDMEFEKTVDGGLTRPRSGSKERGNSTVGMERPHAREESRPRPSERMDTGIGKIQGFVLEIKNIPYKAVQSHLCRFLERFNPLEIRRLYKHHGATGNVVTSDIAYAIFANERDLLAVLKQRDRYILDREVRLVKSSHFQMEEAFRRAPPTPPEAVAEWVIQSDRREEYKDRYHIDRRQNRSDRPADRSIDRPPPRSRSRSPASSHRRSIQVPLPPPPIPHERQRTLLRSPPPPAPVKPEPKLEPMVNPTIQTDPTPSAPIFNFTCVCTKGIPLNATDRDLASFFNGLQIAPNGIRILKSTPGVAYVEFTNPMDCREAIKQDRSYIGIQMVGVSGCTKEEMMQAVHKQLNGGGAGTNGQNEPNPVNRNESNSMGWVANLLSGISQQLQNKQNVESSQVQVKDEPQQQESEISMKKEEIDTDQNLAGNSNMVETPKMPMIDPEVVCSIGIPGCVAALHNLPPQITLEEICQLFHDYQLIDDSVRMHYSNNGDPTGDCLLAFSTPADAQTAVTALNGTTIGGNKIRMYVVGV